MPFGKFKGQAVGSLPDWYLTWLLDQEWFNQKFPLLAEAAGSKLSRVSRD